MDLGIVVEIDINIARLPVGIPRGPLADSPRPIAKLVFAVTTHVKLLRAVQSDVNEIGGNFFRIRKSASCVRDNESAPVAAQKVVKLVVKVRRMAHFERVSELDWTRRFRDSATFQTMIVPACDLLHLT